MKITTSLAVSSSILLLACGGQTDGTSGSASPHQNTSLAVTGGSFGDNTTTSSTMNSKNSSNLATKTAATSTVVTDSSTGAQSISDGSSLAYSIPYTTTPTWVRVFIDTHRNGTTGYVVDGIGSNFLIEKGELYRYSGFNGSWAWTWLKLVSFTREVTPANVKVLWTDLGSPAAIDTVTQTDPPLKISSKITTSLVPSSTTATSTTTTTSTTPTTSTTTTPVTETIQVDYFGDSTVWGGVGGTGYQVAQTPPMVLDANLPVNYVVKNEGTNGASIAKLLAGTDGMHPNWAITVTQTSAKYIIMNYAINDSYERDTTPSSYKINYAKAIDIARSAGKIVILETPNPTNSGTLTQTYADEMKRVAVEKNVPVIDQYYYLKQYMTINNLGIYEMTNDGVHPNQATYILKGQYATERFKEIAGIQ